MGFITLSRLLKFYNLQMLAGDLQSASAARLQQIALVRELRLQNVFPGHQDNQGGGGAYVQQQEIVRISAHGLSQV